MIEMIPYMKLFGGLAYLLLGGDLLVRGAIGLANRTGVSPMLAGLTIVAMGTSAPELMVSMYSALSGYPAIALGNVVGSNVANVLLVLGVPVLIAPLSCVEAGIRSQAMFMLAVTVLFVWLCSTGELTRMHGLLLLGLLAGGTWLTFRGRFAMPGMDADEAEHQMELVLGIPGRRWEIILLSTVGIVLLPLGADLTVDGAVEIAGSLGVPEAVIGASLVAFGTSLPELSTTVIAAFHRSAGVAFGNVIGSNVLNILAIMGATATVVAVPVAASLMALDVWVMLAAALLLTGCILMRVTFGRVAGVAMLVAYGGYMVAIY
jgi:cation:H+ antiporter